MSRRRPWAIAAVCLGGVALLGLAEPAWAQVAADSIPAYRQLGGVSSRAVVWIVAELHLMFAAFVLGVPIFAVVAEAIGLFGGDKRYDRLAKEFTRLLLVAYSATAIWGALLAFALFVLYPRFMQHLSDVFLPSFFLYAGLFFVESFTLYLYYYGWEPWKAGVAKGVHLGLGVLL
ncbi:MAG: cytochrome ubiquinol oxidase subunit I, partial [Gemmatimonadota bacterium]